MTTPRVIISPSAGIKVSLPGYDVTTAALDQFAFNSDFASIGTPLSGTVTDVATGTLGAYVSHLVALGSGFIQPPIFLLNWDQGGNGFNMVEDFWSSAHGSVPATDSEVLGLVTATQADIRCLQEGGFAQSRTVYWKALI